jgi:hypothetical protein
MSIAGRAQGVGQIRETLAGTHRITFAANHQHGRFGSICARLAG